jgi:hypothetical protein
VGLDLVLVERTLTKHQANVATAAKELAVPFSGLRRLTWAKPDLLQTALDQLEVVVASAESGRSSTGIDEAVPLDRVAS